MIGLLLRTVDWCFVEGGRRLVLFIGVAGVMGVIVVVAVLLLAWALAAGLWTAQHGDVRAQPFRSDYDSRRPRP
ncbi:hypothetical protein DY240_30040 [Jiangella rhizosphaerae]|uniref:Uncharacterized protein n=1 Tax=Jiangella rhizosphaerae TaxID=2293569 RepID=A0A418KGS4_9ACTN|nr:hypothetical protein DY240_30040 [Jiangella rhizosphaerae]